MSHKAESKNASNVTAFAHDSGNKNETTSAFFDEEQANQSSLEAWLADEETATRWHSYSIISRAMKGDLAGTAHIDISARVSASIAKEKPHSSAKAGSDKVIAVNHDKHSAAAQKAARRWFQPLAKVAVAAGVAAVAVMTVQTYQTPEAVPAAQEPALLTNPLGGRQPVSYSPSNNASPVTNQQQDVQLRRQAQSYLIDHQQQMLLIERANAAKEKSDSGQPQQDTPSQQ